MDVQEWLAERQLVLASVRQHLLRMQQRMKHQADKKGLNECLLLGIGSFSSSNHICSHQWFGGLTIS